MLYRLRLTLTGLPVDVTRELLVPGDYSVYELHLCLQVALGWQDTAAFEFVRRGLTVGTEPAFAGEGITHDGHRYRHADEITLRALVGQVGHEAIYTYDFGRLWGGRLRVLAKEGSAEELPSCLLVDGLAPPEDLEHKASFGLLLDGLADEGHELHALAKAALGEGFALIPPPAELVTEALRELFAEEVTPLKDDEDDADWGWWDPSKYDDATRLRVLQGEMDEALSHGVEGASAPERRAALLDILRGARGARGS